MKTPAQKRAQQAYYQRHRARISRREKAYYQRNREHIRNRNSKRYYATRILKGRTTRPYDKMIYAGLTRDALMDLYHGKKMSQEAIATLFGATQGATCYWMKKWKIPPRSKEDACERLRIAFTGSNNPKWTGGRHVDHGGYILIRDPKHPRVDNRGYVKEHIKVWMDTHGKEVPQGWQVHHINGNKKDNRPENLVAMSHKKHRRVIPLLQRKIRSLEKRLSAALAVASQTKR